MGGPVEGCCDCCHNKMLHNRVLLEWVAHVTTFQMERYFLSIQ